MIAFLEQVYFFNVFKDISPFFRDLVAILSSVIAGLAIGWEREQIGKPAGLRTFALVCLGSTLFTIIAKEIGSSDAVARVVAQIVAGVGFIGAGSVFRENGKVSGLTTAAGIWVSAAVGVIFGLGYLPFGILITCFVLCLFKVHRALHQWILRDCVYQEFVIEIANPRNKNLIKLCSILDTHENVGFFVDEALDHPITKVSIRCCTKHLQHQEFIKDLSVVDFITHLDPGLVKLASRRELH